MRLSDSIDLLSFNNKIMKTRNSTAIRNYSYIEVTPLKNSSFHLVIKEGKTDE